MKWLEEVLSEVCIKYVEVVVEGVLIYFFFVILIGIGIGFVIFFDFENGFVNLFIEGVI